MFLSSFPKARSFDGARLERRTVIDLDEDSALLFGEILYFGRTSMGESLTHGALMDRVEILRGGRRVWVDAFRLEDDIPKALAAPSTLDEARATGLLVWAGEIPSGLLDAVRDLLPGTHPGDCQGAAAVFENGPLIVRWVGRDAAAVRASFGAVWSSSSAEALGRPNRMPKIWSI